jgi:hypothetical protein
VGALENRAGGEQLCTPPDVGYMADCRPERDNMAWEDPRSVCIEFIYRAQASGGWYGLSRVGEFANMVACYGCFEKVVSAHNKDVKGRNALLSFALFGFPPLWDCSRRDRGSVVRIS